MNGNDARPVKASFKAQALGLQEEMLGKWNNFGVFFQCAGEKKNQQTKSRFCT